MSYESDIQHMFDHHGLTREPMPILVDQKVFNERLVLIREEMNEVIMAYNKYDLAGVLDGLVDLAVVTIGTAVKMGLPFDEAWDIVLDTNITMKERGSVDKRPNMSEDLRKKDNFVKPEKRIAELLLGKGSRAGSLVEAIQSNPLLYNNQAVVLEIHVTTTSNFIELLIEARDEEGNHIIVHTSATQAIEILMGGCDYLIDKLVQFTTSDLGIHSLETFI